MLQGSAASRLGSDTVGKSTNGLILFLYTLSIVWPVKFQLGPVYITFSRIFIICLLIPMLLRLLSGRYGGVKPADYFVVFHCIWVYLALSVNHGLLNVSEFSIMYFVEMTGAYLIGRIFIRSVEDLAVFVKYLLIFILISLPFVIIETQTGKSIIIEFLRDVNPVPNVFKLPGDVDYEPRFGLLRSQFTLVHPIMYGVFCASLMALALTLHTRGKGLPIKTFWGVVVWVTTVTSVSSAAVLSALLQLGFLGFERFTRFIQGRWRLLTAGLVFIYIFVEIFASHSPIAVFVSKFAFNPHTAYNRILIFQYGSAEVMRHPFFGIGNNDWVRAPWMVPSVDNHWLLKFMKYGIPGGGALLVVVIYSLTVAGRAKVAGNEALVLAQRGYMICMIGWCISLGTVAINVEVNSYFMTLLAGGIWLADTARKTDELEEETNPRRRGNQARRGRAPREPIASRGSKRAPRRRDIKSRL